MIFFSLFGAFVGLSDARQKAVGMKTIFFNDIGLIDEFPEADIVINSMIELNESVEKIK